MAFHHLMPPYPELRLELTLFTITQFIRQRDNDLHTTRPYFPSLPFRCSIRSLHGPRSPCSPRFQRNAQAHPDQTPIFHHTPDW